MTTIIADSDLVPMHSPSIQIYVLSRDRLAFCRQAVASVAAQVAPNVKVIISENSENDAVAAQLAAEFPQVTVRRRYPTLPAVDHFNQVLSECSADLVVLFHDDDIMDTRYITRMLELFKSRPEAAAIGCNARIIRHDRLTNEAFMGSFSVESWISSPEQLLKPYLELGMHSPAPFPGYMYRREAIRGLRLNQDQGGKHSDVSFLIEVLQRGPVLWTADRLMNYRFHVANDSRSESVVSRLNWLHHIQTVTGISRRSHLILDCKCLYWLRWLRQNVSLRRMSCPWRMGRRERVAFRFVTGHLFRCLFTRREVRQRAWRRLIRR